MPFPLLAAAIGGAVKVGAAYLNKPKKSDYTADTTYLDKYVASLRGRQADREVYHMAMRPQLRQIGAQGRRMQRQIGYDVAKSGLEGSGIEAQQRLSAGGKVLESIQTASEKATALQLQESRRLGEIVDQATMQREQQISAANKAYQQAQSQWKTGMWQAGLSAVGGLAMGGLEKMSLAKTATEQTAFAEATMPPTLFKQMTAEGVTPADMYKYAQENFSGEGFNPEILTSFEASRGGGTTTTGEAVVRKEPVIEETALPKTKAEGINITTAEQARKAGLKVTEPVQYKDITTAEQAREAGLDVTTADKTDAVQKAAIDQEQQQKADAITRAKQVKQEKLEEELVKKQLAKEAKIEKIRKDREEEAKASSGLNIEEMQAKWKTDIETYKEKAAADKVAAEAKGAQATAKTNVMSTDDKKKDDNKWANLFSKGDVSLGDFSTEDLIEMSKEEDLPYSPSFIRSYIEQYRADDDSAIKKAAAEKATAKTNVISTKDKSGKWNPPIEDILEKQGTGYEAEKMSNKLSFDEAFAAARKKGLEIFQWRNKLYSTVITKE